MNVEGCTIYKNRKDKEIRTVCHSEHEGKQFRVTKVVADHGSEFSG